MSRRLLINSLSGTALYAVNIVAAFIMSPVIIRALGNRDYGLWELVMSVIGYMGLLDMGIGPALVRFVAVADGRQDRNELQQTMSTSFAFFIVVGLCATIMFLMLGYRPALVAGTEGGNIAHIGIVFVLLGINAGMAFPLQVFIATLMGVQWHSFINGVRMVLVIIRSAAAWYLLSVYAGRGLIVMAILEPIFTALQLVLFAGAVHFSKALPPLTVAAVTMHKAKEMIVFGVKSATMLVASRLQNQSVPLIIGNTIGLGSIVYFVMPNRLTDYAKGLSQAVGFPLTPYFGAAIGKGDHDGLLSSWIHTTLVLQIISLAMSVTIVFCGEDFLRLWLGREYAVAGRMVLYILIAGLVADSLATNAFRMLTAQGQHGGCAMIWLVLSAISIPVGIWGAHVWGVAGVAAGVTAVTVLANGITMYSACSVMGISLAAYFKKTVLRILLPLLIMAAVFAVCKYTISVVTYYYLVLSVTVSVACYLCSIWLVTLTAADRNYVLSYIKLKLIS